MCIPIAVGFAVRQSETSGTSGAHWDAHYNSLSVAVADRCRRWLGGLFVPIRGKSPRLVSEWVSVAFRGRHGTACG